MLNHANKIDCFKYSLFMFKLSFTVYMEEQCLKASVNTCGELHQVRAPAVPGVKIW